MSTGAVQRRGRSNRVGDEATSTDEVEALFESRRNSSSSSSASRSQSLSRRQSRNRDALSISQELHHTPAPRYNRSRLAAEQSVLADAASKRMQRSASHSRSTGSQVEQSDSEPELRKSGHAAKPKVEVEVQQAFVETDKSNSIASDGKLKFLTIHEVPEWVRDNPFIFQGYRNDMGWKNAFRSLWYLHNETLNVWTHSIACLIMLIILIISIWYIPNNGEAYAPGLDPTQHAPLPSYCTENELVRRHLAYLEQLARMEDEKLSQNITTPPPIVNFTTPADETATKGLVPLTPEEIESIPAQCRPHAKYGFDINTARRIHAFFKSLPHKTRAGILQARDVLRDALYRVPLTQHAFAEEVERARRRAGKVANALKAASLSAFQDVEELVARSRKLLEETVDKQMDDVSHLQQDLVQNTKRLYRRFASFLTEVMAGDLTHLQVMAMENQQQQQQRAANVTGVSSPRSESLDDHKSSEKSPLIANLDAAKEPLLLLRYLEAGQQFFESLPVWPIAVFLLSAVLCFGFSATFHLFAAVSYQTAMFLNKLDFAGIALLIGGSNIPIIYYAFYCHPTYQALYLTLICIGSFLTFFATVHPKYSGHEFRATRAVLFIVFGLFGVVPFADRKSVV